MNNDELKKVLDEAWTILDVMTYLDYRIDKLQNVLEAYAMAGMKESEYKGDLFAIGELQMLRNAIYEHLEKEEK